MNQVTRGMQNKTIRKVLDEKLGKWLSSIDDEDVRDIAHKNAIVTGGSIASMAMGDKINDFDLYFKTKSATLAVARYYVNKFTKDYKDKYNKDIILRVEETQSVNIKNKSEERVKIICGDSGSHSINENESEIDEDGELIEREEESNDSYSPVFISENAITLTDKIQIVIRFFGEPDKIHDNYDFVHATCYYDLHERNLVMPAEAIRSMQSRTLYYRGSLYPICSLFRIRKFIKRGWNISAGEILKISLQISEVNMLDIDTLKEQLTGVDALYFFELIQIIYENDNASSYNTPYLCEVIDRVFGDIEV